MTIADRTWDHLPPQIHSRIMAATGHAQVRSVEKLAGSDPDPLGRWEVNALAGDRFVHMTLGLREDRSVSEDTRTFLSTEILEVSLTPDGPAVVVQGPAGPESLPVSEPVARALDRQRH